jgi:hypothetical protein
MPGEFDLMPETVICRELGPPESLRFFASAPNHAANCQT